MTDTKPTIDEHSCSYFCDRPECIKAQRDSMREELKRIHSAEMPVEPKVYQQQFFCDDGTIESHEAVLKHDYDALKAYAQRKDAELIAYLRNHAQDFIKLIEAAERHCVKRMLDDNHELRQALAAFKEKS